MNNVTAEQDTKNFLDNFLLIYLVSSWIMAVDFTYDHFLSVGSERHGHDRRGKIEHPGKQSKATIGSPVECLTPLKKREYQEVTQKEP